MTLNETANPAWGAYSTPQTPSCLYKATTWLCFSLLRSAAPVFRRLRHPWGTVSFHNLHNFMYRSLYVTRVETHFVSLVVVSSIFTVLLFRFLYSLNAGSSWSTETRSFDELHWRWAGFTLNKPIVGDHFLILGKFTQPLENQKLNHSIHDHPSSHLLIRHHIEMYRLSRFCIDTKASPCYWHMSHRMVLAWIIFWGLQQYLSTIVCAG